MVFLLFAVAAAAQTTPAPSFEAALVKPSPLDSRVRPTMQGGPGTPDEGRITWRNVTLLSAILRAYDVQSYQVAGPDWLSLRRYEIVAIIPPGATAEQFREMLRSLLAERFDLAIHHAAREFQGYELAVAKNGPKLTVSAPAPDGPGLEMIEGVRGKSVITKLTARAQPLSALVSLLSREFRLPVVDRTGLTGLFDFRLEFAPQPPGALPPASPDHLPEADDSAPNLVTAVQQLGLRLTPARIPLDVLIVDHANPVPMEN
jgi:uncharacterized protein (TIGR03435 family)